MRVNVKGDTASKDVARMYVCELLKAHPNKNITAVDLIVEGDYLKVKCSYAKLPNIA